jgi:hypothetical protein
MELNWQGVEHEITDLTITSLAYAHFKLLGLVMLGALDDFDGLLREVEAIHLLEERVVGLQWKEGVTHSTPHFTDDEGLLRVLQVGLLVLQQLRDFTLQVMSWDCTRVVTYP